MKGDYKEVTVIVGPPRRRRKWDQEVWQRAESGGNNIGIGPGNHVKEERKTVITPPLSTLKHRGS